MKAFRSQEPNSPKVLNECRRLIASNENNNEICQRVQASIDRVVKVEGLTCTCLDGKFVIGGTVKSRDDALMCSVVARVIPGVEAIVSEVKVQD